MGLAVVIPEPGRDGVIAEVVVDAMPEGRGDGATIVEGLRLAS
jgi:hypothetical protein